MTTQACISDAIIEALLNGAALVGREQALAHLAACANCLARFVTQRERSLVGPSDDTVVPDSRYAFVTQLGAGSWGEVWLAVDRRLRREVAIKVLRAERENNPDDQVRILREAETLARFHHPNIVTVYDVGERDGRAFVVMDRIVGEPLPRYIAAKRPHIRKLLRIFFEAGDALATAHRGGVIHRDFKPSNLIVDEAEHVHVTDFGLAAASEAAGLLDLPSQHDLSTLDMQLTPTHAALGTPAYMAPELLRGEPATPLSDQFAYCASVAEAVLGEPLVKRNDVQARGVAPRDLRERLAPCPRWLRAVLVRGLAANPRSRFSDMPTLLRAMQRRRQRALAWRAFAVGTAVASFVAVGLIVARHLRIEACVPQELAEQAPPLASTEMETALDGYHSLLASAYHDVCTATAGAPEFASPKMRARFACLEHARAIAEVVRNTLRDETADRARLLLRRIRTVRRCHSLTAADLAMYDAWTPEDAGRYEAFLRVMAREQVDDIRDPLRDLLEAERKLDSPFVAEVAYALAAVMANHGENAPAKAVAEDAFSQALARGDAETTLRTMLSLSAHEQPHEDAERWLRLAEPLANATRQRSPFLLARAAHHLSRERYIEAKADLSAALETHTSAQEPIEAFVQDMDRVRALSLTARAHAYQGQFADAANAAREVVEATRAQLGPSGYLAAALGQLGSWATDAAHFEQATIALAEASQQFRAQGKMKLALRAECARARALAWSGQTSEALQALTNAMHAAALAHEDAEEVEAASMRAFLLGLRGELEARDAACQRAIAATARGYPPPAVRGIQVEVFCSDGQHATPETVSRLEAAVRTLNAQRDAYTGPDSATARNVLVKAQTELAWAALAVNAPKRAEQHVRAALAAERDQSSGVRLALATAQMQLGQRHAALASLDEALALENSDYAKNVATDLELADAERLAAQALALSHHPADRARAKTLFEQAETRFTQAGAPLRALQVRQAALAVR